METDRNSNYQGISLLSLTYEILFSIHLSQLNPYADHIIGYNQRGFWWNLSTTDCRFCIHYILQKQWEYGLSVYRLFV